jgi:hypothetical protein
MTTVVMKAFQALSMSSMRDALSILCTPSCLEFPIQNAAQCCLCLYYASFLAQ